MPASPKVRRAAAGAAICLTLAVAYGPVATPDARADAGETGEAAGSPARPGGATTLAPGRRPALDEPFANLSHDERFALAPGRALFRDPWVAAPATTTARDGLGPLFNAHACVSCHPGGGRGVLEADGAPSAALLLRLWRPSAEGGGSAPDPVYGDQLQTRGLALPSENPAEAIVRPIAEGEVDVRWAIVSGTYADGTAFELRRPEWRVVAPAYGPLDPATRISARLAPDLRGSGLLDAVPAATLIAREDPDDRDGDGISGRASRIASADGGAAVGRFGWKAAQPTLELQVATALRNDLGITSVPRPTQPCSAAQAACRAAPDGGDAPSGVEIPPVLLEHLTRFTAALAVAARPRAGDDGVRAGEALFASAGCAACHVAASVTDDAAGPAAAQQVIRPYTDLLLHDMGPGLADEVGEGDASGAEWRTAPLWGLGRAVRDPRRASLLHDGRARSVAEAVLWHGGEAQASRDAFVAMPPNQRDALLLFLESL